MRNLSLKTVLLLCSFSWISVSGSESPTVEAQPGEEVTLLCSNFSSRLTQIIWFRAVKRSQPRCVSFMYEPLTHKLCDGFHSGKYEMTSNISTVFLKIKQVNSSESGVYFCGYYISKKPLMFDATYLDVQDEVDGITKLTSVLLGSLVIFLVMVITSLVVKIRKLQKADVEEQNPQRRESQASDELNYAAVTFLPKKKRESSDLHLRGQWSQTPCIQPSDDEAAPAVQSGTDV